MEISRVVGRDREVLDENSPAPTAPIATPGKLAARTAYHWWRRSIVGVTTRALRAASWIASTATNVLPAPVGSTTTPRRPARFQAASASPDRASARAPARAAPRGLRVRARLVLVGKLPQSAEREDQLGVAVSGEPQSAATRGVEPRPSGRAPRLVLAEAADEERAAVEVERHGSSSGRVRPTGRERRLGLGAGRSHGDIVRGDTTSMERCHLPLFIYHLPFIIGGLRRPPYAMPLRHIQLAQ